MKWIASAALIALMGLASPALAAAPGKTPPSCAAIAFRPVASGMTDGEQDAGMYKSRFGRIVVKASVKSGAAQDYYVEVNGKRPADLPNPASLASCAQSKKLPPPAAASGACTGDGFKVLVDHTGNQRLVALYARNGKTWHFCRAGSA
jgi:hypothetical protein